MKFINTLENTVRLGDIGITIPYLGNTVQELAPDFVLKSSAFQQLVLRKKFTIVEATDDRIEQNLVRLVAGLNIQPPEIVPAHIVVRGHFHSNSGYAKANRNLALGLLGLGVSLSIDPINTNSDDLNEMELQQLAMLTRPVLDGSILIHSAIPSFATLSSEETKQFAYRILNTTVEAASVPEQFVKVCNNYDEVWVMSDFCRDVLEAHGVKKPITVVPGSVNTAFYNTHAIPHRFMPQLKPFVFVSVLSWNWRKGYDILLRAYLEEFSSHDDVSLLLVTRYQYDSQGKRLFQTEDDIQQYVRTYGGSSPPQIVRCGRLVAEFEMPRLYRACNCFVLPSRGEGFGLPYLEASLCGLPVIASAFGGQLLFLQNDNSFLLTPDSVNPQDSSRTHIHYWEGQKFAQFNEQSITSLGKMMRYVHDNYPAALERNEKLRCLAADCYNCTAVARLAEERLATIWKTL
jgi:glycosyltransferase involved in cell wall biosynthesis